jgi:hypothetical protein
VVVISVHRLDQLGRAGISTETLLMVVKADEPIGRSGESAQWPGYFSPFGKTGPSDGAQPAKFTDLC